ncbi:MAG TPA: hypothetical protein DD670_12245 [Planctomycetaceae bacterium]|nr:hypothetical protein [Planctomycetaceae bacterium]
MIAYSKLTRQDETMPTDVEQLRLIRAQTLALIVEMTARPKPSYDLDGQTVSWGDYLAKLRATVDWCERNLAGEEPFEIHTRGLT